MALFHCMVRHGTVRYGSLLGGFPLGTIPGTWYFFSTTSVEVPCEPYRYQNVTCKLCCSLIGRRKSSLLRHWTCDTIEGNAYRWSLGQVCTIASSTSGAGWVRENQRGQCDVWLVANKSTWAWPKILHICFITFAPGMSAPILRSPDIWIMHQLV